MISRDLNEVFDGALRLPINGKQYVVTPPSAADGLLLEAMKSMSEAVRAGKQVPPAHQAAVLAATETHEHLDMHRLALGPAYDEMIADGVNYMMLKHAGLTAFVHWTQGEVHAERFWEKYAAAPPARRPRRAPQDRQPKRAKGSRS